MNPLFRGLAASAFALCVAILGTSLDAASATPSGPKHIIGGTIADIADAPWQVALLNASASGSTLYDAQVCGASILNETWVVTAAHCVVDAEPSQVAIAVGVDDLSASRGTNEYDVDRILVHPSYDGGYNDIALLHIEGTLDLDDPNIDPISLPLALDGDSTPATGTDILVTGWGEQEEYNAGNYPINLRKTTLDVLADSPSDNCGSYLRSEWDYRYEVCVGLVGGGSDACQGDSGGPYAATGLDGDGDGTPEPTLIGVTSWGNECALPNYPGFATRVSSYVDWIIPAAPHVSTRYSARTKTHTIRWSYPTSQTLSTPISGYRIEYSNDEGTTWTLARTVGSRVRSVSRKGTSSTRWRVAALSAVNDFSGPYLWADRQGDQLDRGAGVPDAPTRIETIIQTRGVIEFMWTHPESIHGSAVTEYRVYRNRPGKRPQLMGTVSNNEARTSVSTVIRGTHRTYPESAYWVVAVNNYGMSERSTIVSAYSPYQ